MVVVAALIECEGKFLVARRSPGRHLAGYWEFPGGKLEPGETREECLAREIREELGAEIRIGDLFAATVHAYDAHEIELYAYSARLLSDALSLSVHDEVRWAVPAELAGYRLAPADVPIALKLAEGSAP